MKTQEYSMQCPQCGGEQFEMPENPQDHDLVRCDFCNHKLTVAELKEANHEQMMAVAKEQAQELLAEQIKKLKKRLK